MARDFSSKLKDHNLTVNDFLDLRDEWNSLSWVTKGLLLNNDNNKEESNIQTEKIIEEDKKITNFRCCSIYGKEFMIKDVIESNASGNIITYKDINGKRISINTNNILYVVAEDQENEDKDNES